MSVISAWPFPDRGGRTPTVEDWRMAGIERISIDVRDVDYEWFVDVEAFIDLDLDRYLFPRESVERLGEFDEDTGNAWLIDGQVEAEADEMEIEGTVTQVWSVACSRLIVRPAARNTA